MCGCGFKVPSVEPGGEYTERPSPYTVDLKSGTSTSLFNVALSSDPLTLVVVLANLPRFSACQSSSHKFDLRGRRNYAPNITLGTCFTDLQG